MKTKVSFSCRFFYFLESLLVVQALSLELLSLGGDLKALLSRVQDSLDLLEDAVFLLVELGVLVNSLLDEKFNVSQLAEVKVSFTLQSDDGLLEGVVLLLQGSRAGTGGLGNTATGARRDASSAGSGSVGSSSGSSGTGSSSQGVTLAAGDGVVFVVGKVEVPELLGPLQEFEVVLHLALYQ